MKKRIISALLAALTAAALLTSQAFAAGEDKGLDQVLVSADGTVTLVSGHIADEQVSSAQLQLAVEPIDEGEAAVGFTFGAMPAGSLTKSSVNGNILSIYVAGTNALMAQGTTELVLGRLTVSDGTMAKVSLVSGSLKYVYGKELKAQNAENTVSYINVGADKLKSLAEQAEAIKPDTYSNSSYESLQAALTAAKKLLESASPSAEDLASAYRTLSAALGRLQEKDENEPAWETRQALKDAVESASALRESDYSEGFDALQEALGAAKAVLDDPTKGESDLQAAIDALSKARSGLVEKPAQGPGDPGSVPEGKPGPGETSTPSPSPTLTPRATPKLSPSPAAEPSPSPTPGSGTSPAPDASSDAGQEAAQEKLGAPDVYAVTPAPGAAAERGTGASAALWVLLPLLILVLTVCAYVYWRRRNR